MNARRVAGTLAMLLPALATARAEPPVFGTKAEIVTVDVVVLDSEGRPVRGLTREDFVVAEDGRPQAVTAFEAVVVPAPGIVSGATLRPSVARTTSNAGVPATRRTFAIVFDDGHVGPLTIEQAKAAVAAFVEREARAGDRLLLFTTSDARYWTTTRGPEDAAWRDALAAVRSHQRLRTVPACHIAEYEAMRIEDFGDVRVCEMVSRRRLALGCTESILDCRWGSGPAGTGAAQGRAVSPPPGLASSMPAAEAHARGRAGRGGTLRTLRELLRALARSPGRKEVVLVSEGFPLDPAQDGFREVRQQAARANAVVHFLDARGLAVGPEFLSAAGSRGLPESPDLALTTALWRLESGGTKAIAEETGGRVLETNDLAEGLARVADESRAYYLLGYAPTNDRQDGRYRKLKVEVKRPGLEIRARPGYFAASSKEKREPDPVYPINRAMRDLFDADGIPLRLAVYVMGEAALDTDRPKTGVEVLVAAEVRLDALATEDRGGSAVARPKIRLLTSRIGGEWHESDWSLQMTLEPKHEDREAGPGTPGDAWHPILTRLAVAPGQHRARLVVESGGRVGSVTHDFVVPPFTDERLSTPILSDRLLVERGSRAVLPLVRREFPRDSRLHCWVELLGAAEDGTTGMRTATAAFVMRSADGREWASGEASPMRLEQGRPVRLLSVPLAEAPEGENELVLTVRDEVARQTFEAREPFRVLPPPADRP